MRVLGISAYYHDSAAAVVSDGEIVAAAQEERFTRKKHDPDFPRNAVRYCLEACNSNLDEIDHIAFYDKPLLKFERLLETYLAFAPRGFKSFSMAIPIWLREKLFLKDLMLTELAAIGGRKKKEYASKILFSEHHLSHAASAFFPSPFDEAEEGEEGHEEPFDPHDRCDDTARRAHGRVHSATQSLTKKLRMRSVEGQVTVAKPTLLPRNVVFCRADLGRPRLTWTAMCGRTHR